MKAKKNESLLKRLGAGTLSLGVALTGGGFLNCNEPQPAVSKSDTQSAPVAKPQKQVTASKKGSWLDALEAEEQAKAAKILSEMSPEERLAAEKRKAKLETEKRELREKLQSEVTGSEILLIADEYIDDGDNDFETFAPKATLVSEDELSTDTQQQEQK